MKNNDILLPLTAEMFLIRGLVMDKELMIGKLEKFGLSLKEAEVYIHLVRYPYSNGSQIAKKLGYPRTSIYSVLSKLQSKGCILSVPEGEVTSYVAVNPQDLLFRLKKEMEDAAETLNREFKKVGVESTEKQFLNISSQDGVEERLYQLLKSAEKEVYINTNIDLNKFGKFNEVFEELKRRGVRVIFFSFHNHGYEKLGAECYYRNALKGECSKNTKRILLVVDMKAAIMASNYGGEFNGTFSENKLLINLIAEHIHNDIYIMKLENNYRGNFWEDIKINTIQELENQ